MTVSGEEPIDTMRYRIDWSPLPNAGGGALDGGWLLAVPAAHVADPLAADCEAALKAAGAEVTRIDIDCVSTERASLAARLAELEARSPVAGVLSLAALDERPHPDCPAAAAGLMATLALVQALGDLGSTAPLWCATRGAVAVGPGEHVTAPAQSQVWGLGRVAALEHPDRWGGLVDLLGFDGGQAHALAAILADGAEDQVALRPSGGYGRRIARTGRPAPGARHAGWRPAGTVLITGGTGGMGAEVARLAADRGARHLVLLSRSGPDAEGARELEAELAAAGVSVTIGACDVADRAALARVVAELPAAHPLDAVVHAAGVDRTRMLMDMGPDDLARVMNAKVLGAAALDAILEHHTAAPLVVFSSLAGVWGGGGGMAAYAAANAYLDALVDHRRGRGLPGASVAWGPWAQTGMAVHNDGLLELLRRAGLPAMSTRRAMAALGAALDDGEPAAIIADVDWERFPLTFTFSRPRNRLLADLAL